MRTTAAREGCQPRHHSQSLYRCYIVSPSWPLLGQCLLPGSGTVCDPSHMLGIRAWLCKECVPALSACSPCYALFWYHRCQVSSNCNELAAKSVQQLVRTAPHSGQRVSSATYADYTKDLNTVPVITMTQRRCREPCPCLHLVHHRHHRCPCSDNTCQHKQQKTLPPVKYECGPSGTFSCLPQAKYSLGRPLTGVQGPKLF